MSAPEDLKLWRKTVRAELLRKRAAVSREKHQLWNDAITGFLVSGFPMLRQMTVSLYWPFQGEFDPRYAIRRFRDGGAIAALPVVIEKRAPLQFREWWPGVATSKGVFDLPVPEGTRVVVPQALLIPPSHNAVIYSLAAGGTVSVAHLFLAGIFPGIWLAIGLWFTWWWLTRREKLEMPERRSAAEIWQALREAGAEVVGVAVIVERGAEPAMACARVRRMWCWSSARLLRCEK